MRSWAYLLALFALVAGLAAWVYYKPDQEARAGHSLSTLTPAQATRVSIERGGAAAEEASATANAATAAGAPEKVALERAAGAWRLTHPIEARADSFIVERVLGILTARSAVQYPAGDLARYGLDRPRAVVTIDGQTFAYGAINTSTREQYVMTRDRVYLVPLGYASALPRDTDAVLSRDLFAATETPVRFDLPGFVVALEDGTWAVAPAPEEASADERAAWVDAWRTASAVSAARSERAGGSGEGIEVHLKDGRSISMTIAAREPLVLVRNDEGIEYRLAAQAARRLLQPPGAPAR